MSTIYWEIENLPCQDCETKLDVKVGGDQMPGIKFTCPYCHTVNYWDMITLLSMHFGIDEKVSRINHDFKHTGSYHPGKYSSKGLMKNKSKFSEVDRVS